MKKKIIYLGLGFVLIACSETDEVKEEVEQSTEQLEEDQTEASGIIEDEGYVLGPLPEDPLLDVYGEDSLDAGGNYVYPPRDTIFDN